ncbi:MAG: BatD family protein [Pseudarcicella sp.]|nr:BatD family protein [Pseudarcicella sp.]MBP6410758.1 BatD family protein [Pseudarcicella sp.]
MRFIRLIILLGFTFCCLNTLGQKTTYELLKTNTQINQNETLLVGIILHTFDENNVPNCIFPEYAFFTKLGISKSKSTQYIDGKKQISYQITQSYQPQKNGTFNLAESFIEINGQKIKKESVTVAVNGITTNENSAENSFDAPIETEFANKEAFLQIGCSNKKPYVGEGFTLTLTFFVSENNIVPMQFDNNEVQIPEIVKRIKPLNCWEESYHLNEALENTVTIKGKKMKAYTFYKATFYPLSDKKIYIPQQTLTLKTDATEANLQKSIHFKSNLLKIQPKALPPHPAKEKAIVGQFELKEEILNPNNMVGNAIEYTVILTGNGNISTIAAPILEKNNLFDFYPPTENTQIITNKNGIIGNKSFTFSIIPKQAGKFVLNKYFQWIYFDPIKSKYDTLKSSLQLNIKGKSLETKTTNKTFDDIYDELEEVPTVLNEKKYTDILETQFNTLTIILLSCMIYIFWKSNNNSKK